MSSANCVTKKTTLSTWTPLNHQVINSKVFEERRSLLAKWFDRWSDRQRKAVLQDLVLSCSLEQLRFLSRSLGRRLPLQAADFTCLLPRALSLYLFSFLDPRSLCRCAQVSWRWRGIVELDRLWMPKCLRLGWSIGFSPTPYERGVWKRHYIQNVQEVQLSSSQTASSHHQSVVPNGTLTSSGQDDTSATSSIIKDRPASTSKAGSKNDKQPNTPPPWKVNDRNPKDTLRFNYLDNLDPTEPNLKGAAICHGLTPSPDGRRQKSLSEAHYKLRKAKSLMFLSSNSKTQHPPPFDPHSDTQTRPHWARRSQDPPVTKETARSLLLQVEWNAGVRPAPVRSAVPRLSVEALRASRRSHRSPPSVPLFEVQPWTVSASHTR
ncbi:F-box only protein 16 [Betta splendens]|uniref:F-box only protein 16 n=1 Tax=Betta splendens TaxID=158456 RepID=A0A6P7LQK6_BETSP|nr:F-box only protein 16 [Betta splendens]